MSLVGMGFLGQACSAALSPGNCVSAGGSYDDSAETCNCGVPGGTGPGSGFTLDQQKALCTQAGADTAWDSTTNTCKPIGSAPAPVTSNNCANNANPGTFWDVNCPWYCAVGGTGLWGGNDCWPCSNVCPSGTNFDTTNNVCSANPTTTKCVQGIPGTPSLSIPFGAWVGIGAVAALLLYRAIK